MRSTVELNEHLNKQLRSWADLMGLTFKEALNRALAAGLSTLSNTTTGQKPNKKMFKVRPKDLGLRSGIDELHLNRLVDEIEDTL